MKIIFSTLLLLSFLSCEAKQSGKQEQTGYYKLQGELAADMLVCSDGIKYRSLDKFEMTVMKGWTQQFRDNWSMDYYLKELSPHLGKRINEKLAAFQNKLSLVKTMPAAADNTVPSIPNGCSLAIGLTSRIIDGQIHYEALEEAWSILTDEEKFVMSLREVLKSESSIGDGLDLRNLTQSLVAKQNGTIELARRAGIQMDYKRGDYILSFRMDSEVESSHPCRIEFKNGYIYDVCALPKPKKQLKFFAYSYTSLEIETNDSAPLDLKAFGLAAKATALVMTDREIGITLSEPLRIKNTLMDLACEGDLYFEGRFYGDFKLESAEGIQCKLSAGSKGLVYVEGAWRELEPVNLQTDPKESAFSFEASLSSKELELIQAVFTKPETIKVENNSVALKSIKVKKLPLLGSILSTTYELAGESSWNIGNDTCVISGTVLNKKSFWEVSFPRGCEVHFRDQIIAISSAELVKGKLRAFTTTSHIPFEVPEMKKPVLFTGNIELDQWDKFYAGNLVNETKLHVRYDNNWTFPPGTPVISEYSNLRSFDSKQYFELKEPYALHLAGEKKREVLFKGKTLLTEEGTVKEGFLAEKASIKIRGKERVLPIGTHIAYSYNYGYEIKE